MKSAFTLSEVLIALVIIGVVAAMTVPGVMNSVQNKEFIVGYKKAHSDLARAAMKGVAFGEFPLRVKKYDAETTLDEWNIIKQQFGVAKVCENNNAYDCWVDADRLCIGCTDGGLGVPSQSTKAFVDLSGKAWGLYTTSENIFIVDTNGDKKPNQFGKDRWIFTFAGADGKRVCNETSGADQEYSCKNPGFPMKVIPFVDYDINTFNQAWCQHPPCRYHSWLIEL